MTSNSLSDMLDHFEDSLLVRDIAQPLLTCGADDDAAAVAQMLREKGFDVVGVRRDGVLLGYALADSLTDGTAASKAIPFSHLDIVGARTPLVDLLPLMPNKDRLFVLQRAEITHIVTRSDLHKPLVNLVLFGHVTLLEMQLLQLVSVCFPGESFREVLKPDRIARAETLLIARRNRNEDIGLADCLQMADKRTLLCKDLALAQFFGFESKGRFETFLRDAEKLRDKLAHAQDVVSGTCWTDIICVFNSIVRFVRECGQRNEEFIRQFSGTRSERA